MFCAKFFRRGIRHGTVACLGKQPFMYAMVHAAVSEMKVAYPELLDEEDRIGRTVLQEEQQFARVLGLGADVESQQLFGARI